MNDRPKAHIVRNGYRRRLLELMFKSTGVSGLYLHGDLADWDWPVENGCPAQDAAASPHPAGTRLTAALKKICECYPCVDGSRKLLEYLGKTEADDTPLPLETILESNGFLDALWALRVVDGHQGAIRLYACYCARQVLPVFERWFPGDNRTRQAIETAERFAAGRASVTELEAARSAAWASINCNVTAGANGAALTAGKAASDNAVKAVWGTVKNAVLSVRSDALWEEQKDRTLKMRTVKADLTREFVRLCRLEGEYGEVSAQEADRREEQQ